MPPLVSVVVNNHNYARYVGEAVESALAQTYPDVEVVVVDDGSTDDSRDVIDAFREQVRVVFKPNGGQASALNAGFRESRGSIVLFLDADDMLLPDAVAAVVAAPWQTHTAKVQFRLEVVDENGVALGGHYPAGRMLSGELSRLVLSVGRYRYPPTSGNAFARWTLERLLPIPEEEWRNNPDGYLLLLSPFLGEVVSLDRVFGRYRTHGRNMWTMHTLDARRLREQLAVDEAKLRTLRAWAPRLGFDPPDGRWCLRVLDHVQTRLASLRLQPRDHPYAGDRAVRLAWHGVRAALADRGRRVRGRLLFALWFVMTATAPARFLQPLLRLGFLREARPRFLRSAGS